MQRTGFGETTESSKFGVKSHSSKTKKIARVHQNSFLGPFLFLIYTNNLNKMYKAFYSISLC